MPRDDTSPLRLISRKELLLSRYEQCLDAGGHTPVYAWPWFLDIMAREWEVLVWEEYRYVMPVARHRKWGIGYVYQPPFAQQLGIFPQPPPEITFQFFSFLASEYRYIHTTSGFGDQEARKAGFEVFSLHTRLLALQPGYKAVAQGYDDYITQNLKKAALHGVTVTPEKNTEIFFAMQRLAREIPMPAQSWPRLRRLMEATLSDGRGVLLAARTNDQEVVAAAFFILWRQRAYYMAVCSSPRGREQRAGFLLLDTFFREHAGQPLTFDFEGSSVTGVDRFFAAFGSTSAPYFLFHLNRLPPILRKIKQ